MRARCLECHKEIAWTEEHKQGLHAMEDKGSCTSCHPDHAGREFSMIRWEEGSAENFKHARTGWPLAGKHVSVPCQDCHKESLRTSEAARLGPKREGGYLGLDGTCVACHREKDVHRGALGTHCEKCHSSSAWKPVSGFDHAKTDFPLTGKHVAVACEKCHLSPALHPALNREGKPIPVYKPVPHAECSSCHQDPHAGRLGTACTHCHVTDTWKSVNKQAFDHDRTRYPLGGRHVALKCAACHDPVSAWGDRPPFASCGSCHKDEHAGKATLAGKIVDCQACHRVEGFALPTFTVAQHAATKLPLTGKHAALQCEECHRKNPPGVPSQSLGKAGILIRMAAGACRDCHEDPHGSQLAARPDKGACEACHHVEGWKPATFSVAQHAKLRLPLDGRHAKVACAACHGPQRSGLPPLPASETIGKAGVQITRLDAACTACHLDPHDGRFSAKGERAKPAGCLACHSVEAFRPSRVDVAAHASFSYPLEGAHRAVPCFGCHAESKAPAIQSSLLLWRSRAPAMPFTTKGEHCEDCHQSPHGLQFARRKDGGACQSCHGPDSFRPADRFNHDRDADFPLAGAHSRVPCAGCHVSRTIAPGKSLVLYRGISKDCRSCHVSMKPGSSTGAVAPAPAKTKEGRS
jgi:hypothetical protein